MADIDYGEFERAVTRALRKAGGSGGGLFSGGGSGSSSGTNGGILDTIGNKAKGAANYLSDSLEGAGRAVDNQIDTYNKLSDAGANFTGDLVDMNVSAVQARGSLEDMTDVIVANAKQMTNLGGTVTQGSKNFTKLAKELYDSNIGKDMMNLGYSTREINELLALQVGSQRRVNMADAESKQRILASTLSLATEMDKMAKLTGISRKEQEEAIKVAQQDAAVQAKFIELEQQYGKAKADAIKEEFERGLVLAKAANQGQAFMEQFATGTLKTEKAQMQHTMGGAVGQDFSQIANKLAGGQLGEVTKNQEKIMKDAAELRNSPAFLQIAKMHDVSGPAGAMAGEMMTTLGTYDNSIKSYMDQGLTRDEAISKLLDDATKEQQGITPEGKEVGQTSRAVIGAKEAVLGAKSDLATEGQKAFGDSLNNAAGAVNKFAEGITGAKDLKSAFDSAAPLFVESFKDAMHGIKDIVVDSANLIIGGEAIPKRAKGTIGTTGQLYENPGLVLVGEGNEAESILTETNMMNFAKSSLASGKEQAYNELGNAITSFNQSNKMPEIDTGSISKQINSTINITGGGTTIPQDQLNKPKLIANVKDPEEELDNIIKKYETGINGVRETIKQQLGENASFEEIENSIKNNPLAKTLQEEYDRSVDNLNFDDIDAFDNIHEQIKTDMQNTTDVIKQGVTKYNTFVDNNVNSTDTLVNSVLSSFGVMNSSYENHINDMIGFKDESFDIDKKYAEQENIFNESKNAELSKVSQNSIGNITKNITDIGQGALGLLGPVGTSLGKVIGSVSTDVTKFATKTTDDITNIFTDSKKTPTKTTDDITNIFTDSKKTPTVANTQNVQYQHVEKSKERADEIAKINEGFLTTMSSKMSKESQKYSDDTFKRNFNRISAMEGKEKADEYAKNFERDKAKFLASQPTQSYKITDDLKVIDQKDKISPPTTSKAMDSIESTQRQIDDKLEKLFGIENTNKPKQSENKQTKYNEEPSKPKQEIVKKEATLNDVVMSLEMLNKQMSQLLTQHEDIGRKQVKATRDNNGNLFKI